MHSGIATGTGRYAERLINCFLKTNLEIEKMPIVRKETSVICKQFSGAPSQKSVDELKNPRGKIVHSLLDAIHPKIGALTVNHVIPLKERDDLHYRNKGNDFALSCFKNAEKIIAFVQSGKKRSVEITEMEADKTDSVPRSIDHGQLPYDLETGPKRDDRKTMIGATNFNPKKIYDSLFNASDGNIDSGIIHPTPANAWLNRRDKLDKHLSRYDNVMMIGEFSQETLRRCISTDYLLEHLSENEGSSDTSTEALPYDTNVFVNIFEGMLSYEALSISPYTSDISIKVDDEVNHEKIPEAFADYSKKYSVNITAEKTVETNGKVAGGP